MPTTPSSSASSPTPAPTTPEPAKIARPEWAPESYWDAEKSAIKPEFGEHYKTLATFQATEESRRLTLPTTPEAYEFKNSQSFQPPQGVEFKINPNDPLATQARGWAHKHGVSQAAFEEMLDLYAGGQVANVQTLKTARDAEVSKLGTAGPARITAAQNFFNAQLGEDLGKHFGTMLVTARHVEAVEKLMAAFRNQGGGSFSPPRAPNEPTRLSSEQYNKLTYSEKKDYAARMNGSATH